MQRFYSVRNALPGLPLSGQTVKGAATNMMNTAYEPFRNVAASSSPPLDGQHRGAATYVRRRKTDSRGSKILRFISCFLEIVMAACIVSMAARIVVILDSTSTSRIMWPYGMMLKAWPPGGMLAVSTYLMLAGGAFALFINGVLMMLLCVRRGDNGTSLFAGRFTLFIRFITFAALTTAVILDAIAHPNLRSWSCITKQFEEDVRDNSIGMASVCFDLTAGFTLTIGLAALELLNLAFGFWSMVKLRRNRQVRIRVAGTPRVYDKVVDESQREDDEIPMLDVHQRGQMQEHI